ncbi:MAG TPA: tyrosine-type recombinase/integrase [Longimicrobiales bacterium]|nr:tyrosine-type recombinase/integrase [Longimicrobiales bacterium]
MTALRSALEDYLILRRSMGFKLHRAGRLLAQFVGHCEAAGSETVTTQLALSWATLPAGGSQSWHAGRLSVVRGFARYLALLDERTEVPPPDLLPHGSHRACPYLYSAEDVIALMGAARKLSSPLRRATFSTLIGLLYVSGMRIGEALDLNRDDVHLDQQVIVVRDSKFGKSREVPIHESTARALGAYARQRDDLCPRAGSPAFFISLAGTRLRYCNVHLCFQGLVREAGLTPRSPTCRPRPHDLRHTFAVSTLIDWYRDGLEVEPRMPRLSTYLGHVHPAHTYWYLEAAPELLALAAARLEANTEPDA